MYIDGQPVEIPGWYPSEGDDEDDPRADGRHRVLGVSTPPRGDEDDLPGGLRGPGGRWCPSPG